MNDICDIIHYDILPIYMLLALQHFSLPYDMTLIQIKLT